PSAVRRRPSPPARCAVVAPGSGRPRTPPSRPPQETRNVSVATIVIRGGTFVPAAKPVATGPEFASRYDRSRHGADGRGRSRHDAAGGVTVAAPRDDRRPSFVCGEVALRSPPDHAPGDPDHPHRRGLCRGALARWLEATPSNAVR